MAKKRKREKGKPGGEDLRLSPEARIAPRFDSASIAKYPVAEPGRMGFRVLDNCAEEHIM